LLEFSKPQMPKGTAIFMDPARVRKELMKNITYISRLSNTRRPICTFISTICL